MSSVIFNEMMRHDKTVGKAVVDQYEKLKSAGLLFDVSFGTAKLGFTLVLGRLTGSPRARLLVDETFESCAGYDVLRPCVVSAKARPSDSRAGSTNSSQSTGRS